VEGSCEPFDEQTLGFHKIFENSRVAPQLVINKAKLKGDQRSEVQ
jgi:hypothetical protein